MIKITVKGAERFLEVLCKHGGSVGDTDCGHNDIFVYIHTAAVETNDFQRHTVLLSKRTKL
jgi:hypothetical protein